MKIQQFLVLILTLFTPFIHKNYFVANILIVIFRILLIFLKNIFKNSLKNYIKNFKNFLILSYNSLIYFKFYRYNINFDNINYLYC